jgi:hypothetical protein
MYRQYKTVQQKEWLFFNGKPPSAIETSQQPTKSRFPFRAFWRIRRNFMGRPASVLEEPESERPAACGHYRKGLPLAPATAAWVCGRVSGGSTGESGDPEIADRSFQK